MPEPVSIRRTVLAEALVSPCVDIFREKFPEPTPRSSVSIARSGSPEPASLRPVD